MEYRKEPTDIDYKTKWQVLWESICNWWKNDHPKFNFDAIVFHIMRVVMGAAVISGVILSFLLVTIFFAWATGPFMILLEATSWWKIFGIIGGSIASIFVSYMIGKRFLTKM